MSAPIKQRIADTRAAIIAELAKLGLPASLVRLESDYESRLDSVATVGEGTTRHSWRGEGSGMVEACVSYVSAFDDYRSIFRSRTFKETEKKPVDAAKVAACIAERQKIWSANEAARAASKRGLKSFANAVGKRGHDDYSARAKADRVDVSFAITDIDRVGPILDGLAALLRKP